MFQNQITFSRAAPEKPKPVKRTVVFKPEIASTLDQLADRNGTSKNATIVEAIRFYDFAISLIDRGANIVIEENGEFSKLKIKD